MKQFVKALSRDGTCLKYLCQQFSHLLKNKLKEGFYVGPDIRKVIFDLNIESP